MIDPASLQVIRRARQAKTDRIDVERMLRSLLAYLRGEQKFSGLDALKAQIADDANRARELLARR